MGGVPRAVYELSIAQQEQGHEISVATTAVSSPGRFIRPSAFGPEDRLQNGGSRLEVHHNNVRIFYYRSFSGRLFSLAEVYWIPGMRKSLDRLIDETSPEAIHVHEFRTGLSAAAAACTRKRGVPIVLSTHGSLFPPVDTRWKTALKKRFDRSVGRRILSQVSAFHALSSHEADDIRRLTGGDTKRIQIIPHGFRPAKATPPRYPSGLPSLLFVGRIYPVKGIETLLEAFGMLKRRYPGIGLLLAGHANRSYLRSLMRRFDLKTTTETIWEPGEAVYAGHFSPSVVAERLASASCLVLPSLYEVWGLVILEALSAGCPVVATSVCGCLEHLGDPGGLVVAPPHDPESLVRAISQLLDDPVQPAPLPPHLSWKSVAGEMESLYRRVMR